MTIALGILAGPAMILAADTELSTVASKTSTGKILWTRDLPVAGREASVFGITGSGPFAYLEAIYQDMRKLFLQHRSDGLDELGIRFQQRLEEFYRAHVIPFSSYADPPDFWLILAVERGGQRRMWVSERNLLSEVQGHAAVGIGEMQARILLNSLNLPVNIQTAQLLAAYLIFRTKQAVPGCGMETDVICMQNADVTGLHRRQVRKLEEVFQNYGVIEASLLHRMLGSDYDFSEEDRLSKAFASIKDEIEKIISPQGAPQSRKSPKHGRKSQQP